MGKLDDLFDQAEGRATTLDDLFNQAEVGAGSGRMTPFLAAAVPKLVATDYASEVIAKLNEVTKNLKNTLTTLCRLM